MANLPFEVFVLFLSIALFIGLIGIIMGIRKIDGAPAITVFAGILIFTQVVITSNIIFPNSPQTTQDINIQELYHLHDWTNELTIFQGGNEGRAIFVTADSSLVSDDFFNRLDCIQLPIKKNGSPTGIAEIGILDANNNIKPILFGTLDVSTLTSEFSWFEFCLPASQHHFIAPNDRIGIKYDSGGNSTNNIVIAVDNNNPINTNIFMQRFSSGSMTWVDESSVDMSAVLYNRAMTENIIPYTYDFNQNDIWAYMIALSALFMFIGIILQFKK